MSDTKPCSKRVLWCLCASLVVGTFSSHAAQFPSDPNNAALLYYQAFLLCPGNDDIPKDVAGVFRDESGGDTTAYRKFAKDYQHVIQPVESASNIKRCDWALSYSQTGTASKVRGKLTELIRPLTFLIGASVRSLAADGNYKAALSQSLMLRRVAWHIGDDPEEFDAAVLETLQQRAFLCMRFVLDVMSPDEKTLRWLREQLAAGPQVSDVLPTRIKQDFEQLILRMKREPGDSLSHLRQKLAEKANSEAEKKRALALKDAELLKLIQESYTEFVGSVLETIASDMSYEQKYARLIKLDEQYQEQAKSDPAIIFALTVRAHTVPGLYRLQTEDTAWCNAFRNAVEVYLLKATTGRLPEVLPDGLPKDPFSGKNFKYEITEEGFVLSCGVGDRILKYRFRVQEKR